MNFLENILHQSKEYDNAEIINTHAKQVSRVKSQ